MFDYKLIEALAMVVREGGFDKGAKELYLTQSAISQRLKQLEELTGQVLVARSTPPLGAPAGQRLLKHYLQVNNEYFARQPCNSRSLLALLESEIKAS